MKTKLLVIILTLPLSTASFAVGHKSFDIFPRDLPDRDWVSFAADGYSTSVTGVIYRGGTMFPGMPLGALGTGFISLGTDGTLDYVNTIFNTFLERKEAAQRAAKAQGLSEANVYKRENVPSFCLPFLGLALDGKATVLCLKPIAGARHARQIDYWGHYPVADLQFDIDSPVQVALRAWTPFMPCDSVASNTPGSVFEVRLINTGSRSLKGTLAFTFSGPYSLDPPGPAASTADVQRESVKGEFTGVYIKGKRDGLEVGYALGVMGTTEVRSGGALAEDAAAWNSISSSLPTPGSDNAGSSVAVDFELQPGAVRTVRFVLAWYAPVWQSKIPDEWVDEYHLATSKKSHPYINMYSTRFNSAFEVADYLTKRHAALLEKILAWQQVVYGENQLPGWLQDSLVNVLSILAQESFMMRSPDPHHWWGDKGFFCVNESLISCSQQACSGNDEFGEWAVNLLFPELGLRKLTAFKHYQKVGTGDAGLTPSTLGAGTEPDAPWFYQVWTTDPQVYVHLVDRYRLSSRNDKILDEWYPSVKACVNLMLNHFDQDGDALPDVRGTNHYLDAWPMDGGCACHVSSYWLATLRIAERMARMENDTELADQCRSWLTKAEASLEQKLWNSAAGSYYLYRDVASGKQSDTVVCDQLIGEMFARLHGFSDAPPPQRIDTVLHTLERLNVAATSYGIRLASRPDGTEDKTAYYSPFMVPSYSTLCVASTMLRSDDPHFKNLGLEIVRRTWHNIEIRQNMTWDQPCMVKTDGTRAWGLEYYHNTMLWTLPIAVLGQDIPRSLLSRRVYLSGPDSGCHSSDRSGSKFIEQVKSSAPLRLPEGSTTV